MTAREQFYSDYRTYRRALRLALFDNSLDSFTALRIKMPIMHKLYTSFARPPNCYSSLYKRGEVYKINGKWYYQDFPVALRGNN